MVNNIKALRSETELLLAGKMALVSWGRLASRSACSDRGAQGSTF